MLETRTLADIIQSKISLGPQNSRGFFEVRCEVCNDHSVRGGFRFDGDSTGYYCWNCAAAARYEEGSGRLSRNFRQILEAFGITKEDLVGLRSGIFAEPKPEQDISLEALKKVKLHTPEVALPDRSHLIGSEGHEEFQIPLAEYLLKRKVDPVAIRAYYSLDPRYLNRVIIPFFRDDKIIYWQARHIEDGVKPRYLNSPVARDAVMYGYNHIFTWSEDPLFVTEGVFDAIALNGICILGSSLNAAKLEVLQKCRRRLIFIIDRDKTGSELGKAVIENGWEISFVDTEAGDASKSVQEFGLPYTIYRLMKNATRKTNKDASRIMLGLGVLEGRLGRFR